MRKLSGLVVLLILVVGDVSIPQENMYEDEKIFWDNPKQIMVPDEEIAFTAQEYRQNKNEGIYFMSRFNDGWVLMINLFHLKTNLFNKWGIYILFCEPDGKTHWETFEMDPKKIYFDTDRLFVSDGVNTIQGGGNIYYVDLNLSKITCSLMFTNILDSWKPGDGIDYFTSDRQNFMIRILSSPWAVVRGDISFDSTSMKVKGVGYGEKSLIIGPLTKQNPYLHAFRVFTDKDAEDEDRWFIGLLDTQSHESFGGFRIPRLNVAKGNEWLFTTDEYTLTPSGYSSPPDMPYSYPTALQLYANNGKYELQGVYKTGVLFNVTDVINEIPPILRPLALIFVKRPIYFRFLGEFEGQIRYPDGSLEWLHLYGPYEYVIVR